MKIRKPKPILRTQPAELRCYWRNCRAEFDDIESLIKHVHDEVAKSEAQCALSKQWHCHWNDCSRLKCFDVKYQLLAHMRIHTKERPFACTIDDCTCTFRRRENLMTHIRTHSGERPYTCQFPNCEKAFTNASDRAKHQTRTHSEGKPFVCRVVDCPKAYTDPSSLRKHVNGIHGEEVYNLMRKIKDIEDANDGEVHYIYISSDPGLGETRIVTYTEARALSDPVKVDVKRCEVEKFIDRQIALARIINAEKAKARVAKQRVIKHETIRILPPPSQVILVPYVKQETNPMQHSPFQNENNHDPMLVSLNQDDDNLIKYQELLSESTNSCFNATSSSSSRKRSMTNRDDVPSYFDLGEDDFSATRDWDATPGAMNEDYTMIHSVRRSAYDGINDIWDVDIDAPAASGFPVDPDTPSMFKPDYPSSSVNTNSIYDDFFDKNGLGLSSPDKRYTMVLGDQNEDVFSRAFA